MRKAKEKPVEKIVFHNDYGLCKIVKDRVGVTRKHGSAPLAVPLKKLVNLHNKPMHAINTTGQRVKHILTNKFGSINYVDRYSNNIVSVRYDDGFTDNYINTALLEPEDRQSGLDASYKTIVPGNNVFHVVHHYTGVTTDHTIFVEEFHRSYSTHCFYDNQINELQELDVAIQNIDASKFCLGANVTNAFQNMPRITGTIVSPELKDMTGYVLVKHKGKKANPYQVCHVLELKII